MKQQGAVMKKESKHWTIKEINRLLTMCERGASTSEIAEKLDRNEKAISNKIYRMRQQLSYRSYRPRKNGDPEPSFENVMNEKEWMPWFKRLFK
jgi:IS30 family transposase